MEAIDEIVDRIKVVGERSVFDAYNQDISNLCILNRYASEWNLGVAF
jgi:hypothetical protein